MKEDDVHPLVTVTNIRPEDIPEVPANKFLMRGGPPSEKDKKDKRNRGKKHIIILLYILSLSKQF